MAVVTNFTIGWFHFYFFLLFDREIFLFDIKPTERIVFLIYPTLFDFKFVNHLFICRKFFNVSKLYVIVSFHRSTMKVKLQFHIEQRPIIASYHINY